MAMLTDSRARLIRDYEMKEAKLYDRNFDIFWGPFPTRFSALRHPPPARAMYFAWRPCVLDAD